METRPRSIAKTCVHAVSAAAVNVDFETKLETSGGVHWQRWTPPPPPLCTRLNYHGVNLRTGWRSELSYPSPWPYESDLTIWKRPIIWNFFRTFFGCPEAVAWLMLPKWLEVFLSFLLLSVSTLFIIIIQDLHPAVAGNQFRRWPSPFPAKLQVASSRLSSGCSETKNQ